MSSPRLWLGVILGMAACAEVPATFHPAADDDGGMPTTDAGPELRSVRVGLSGFDAVTAHTVQLWALDARGATRLSWSVAPMSTGSRDLVFTENASTHVLDLVGYIDLNDNGVFDARTDRLFADERATGDATEILLTPQSVAVLADIPRVGRAPIRAHFVRFAHHLGTSLELRVTDKLTRADVAVLDLPALTEDSFDALIPDAVEPNSTYEIRVYLDINENGIYDVHGDFGATFERTADADGLSFQHDHFDQT